MSVEKNAERLLFLIPFVASQKDGVPLATLREMLDVDEKTLISLLETGSLVGSPEGSPDEYVGLTLDDDRVHVFLPQRFRRPVRFTVRELWALLLALAPLAASPLPELSERARALREKLLDLSSRRAASAFEPAVRSAATPTERDDVFHQVERAVVERRAVEIEYWSKSRDALGTREIEPLSLLVEGGAWYVAAKDEKTYRLDRVKRATLLDRTFTVSAAEIERLRERAFSESNAEFVVLEGGVRRTLHGEVNASTHAYLREGRGRRVLLSPEEAREGFVRETRELLARYESAR